MRYFSLYMKNENIDDIWVIDAIHDMVNKLECNLGIIKEIGQRSELMIFWYGSEYEELDEIDSIQLLMNYLYDNIFADIIAEFLINHFIFFIRKICVVEKVKKL